MTQVNAVYVQTVEIYNMARAFAAAYNPHAVTFTEAVNQPAKIHQKLGSVAAGTGHDCFLKGILCHVDMYCSLGFLGQISRYRNVDIVSSMSLMHSPLKVLMNEFLMSKVDNRIKDILFQKAFEGSLVEGDFPRSTMVGISFVTNYLQLKTIYLQRKTHRLHEWQELCKLLEDDNVFKHFKQLTQKESYAKEVNN